MLIHELGHYSEMQITYENVLQNYSRQYIATTATAAFKSSIDEKHIINDVENPVMSSIDPSFKKRDASRYTEGMILYENKQGYPAVSEAEKANLIQAMKASGREVPADLALSPQSQLDIKPVENQVNEGQQVSATVSAAIIEKQYDQLVKEGVSEAVVNSLRKQTNETIAANLANETLPTFEKIVDADQELS